MTLGWESQTLDSISVMPAWKQTYKQTEKQKAHICSVTIPERQCDVLLLHPRQDSATACLWGAAGWSHY